MILKNYGHTAAEITIDSAEKPISADELMRMLVAHGVTAAKIIRTKGKRTSKRAPDDGQMLLSDFGFFGSTTTGDERA